MSAVEMTGQRFGRLVVVSRDGTNSERKATWLCLCDCGAEKVITGRRLRDGTLSCGCLHREVLSANNSRLKRKDAPGYLAAHRRVYRARGKATAHACPCGEPAAQWAYDHTDPAELSGIVKYSSGRRELAAYSCDPARYIAMCSPCHARFDRAVSGAV